MTNSTRRENKLTVLECENIILQSGQDMSRQIIEKFVIYHYHIYNVHEHTLEQSINLIDFFIYLSYSIYKLSFNSISIVRKITCSINILVLKQCVVFVC